MCLSSERNPPVTHLQSCALIPQKNVHSDKFVSYMCEYVLPSMGDIVATEGESDTHLELFKLFAELSSHCAVIDEARVETVFNKLIVSRCAAYITSF